MTATIQNCVNSLALRVPLGVAKQSHVKDGDPVTLKVGASGLTVKMLRRKRELDSLRGLAWHARQVCCPNRALGRLFV